MTHELNAFSAYLDHNEQLPLRVQSQGNLFQLDVDMASLSHPEKLGKHFENGLKLVDEHGDAIPGTAEFDAKRKLLTFPNIDLPESAKQNGQHLTLQFYGQPIVTFTYQGGELVANTEQKYLNQRLIIDELRMIADHEVEPQKGLPIDRKLLEGFDPKLHTPITDLHTHSSAQLSAAEIVGIAKKHDIKYPTELLEKLGITLDDTEKKSLTTSKGLRFSPGEHEGLKCEQDGVACEAIPITKLSDAHLKVLQNQLKIAQDQIICFSDFDREYYRFVNPIVKNPNITEDMIMKIAEDYKSKGVQYAELSTASMLNLDELEAKWFEQMIKATKKAEEATGVKLRYLISVPRNYSQSQVLGELEKIKFAARHPLIAGVDLVGYEFNGTADFKQTLENVARWAQTPQGTDLTKEEKWDFARDFTIRIHAGETGKNSNNVAEAVKIAQKGIHVRIAHAIHERDNSKLDKLIHKLSHDKPPYVSMEFCAPSNIAYNNVQDLKELKKPYARWLKACKNWFLGSDGTGAIQTTPVQLALSALGTGAITCHDLAKMRDSEKEFIANEEIRFKEKTNSYAMHYKGGDAEFLKEFAGRVAEVKASSNPLQVVPRKPLKPVILDKMFDGRMPIMVAGASGESIDDVTGQTQREIRRALHMLVNSSDPKKVYFVVGRSKRDGLTALLDEAIMEYNKDHPQNEFRVLALVAKGTPEYPNSMTQGVERDINRDEVPDMLVNFMQERRDGVTEMVKDKEGHSKIGADGKQETKIVVPKTPGLCVFIGGGNFTSHMIRKCKDKKLDYFLMENALGASQSFANKTLPSHRFSDGRGLLSKLSGFLEQEVREVKRQLFPDAFDITDRSSMDQLQTAAAKRYVLPEKTAGGLNPIQVDPNNLLTRVSLPRR